MDITTLSIFENRCWVNGQWITSERTLDVTNPFDGSVLTSVPILEEPENKQSL